MITVRWRIAILGRDAPMMPSADPPGPGHQRRIIKGSVYEAQTGESMPYTNVYLAGTSLGTMAFTDGYYIIRGLRPGAYTVKSSCISYAVASATVVVEPARS